jgi:hypothetical protein
MWNEIIRRLPAYRSAVLTWTDDAGYPFSVRCNPLPDEQTQVLLVHLPPGVPARSGPAGLLCHKHDEQLWNQQSFLLRGALAQEGQRWIFRPQQLVIGIEQHPLSFYRFVRDSRRRASSYLASRGLRRPAIPWQAINSVKERALRKRKEAQEGEKPA